MADYIKGVQIVTTVIGVKGYFVFIAAVGLLVVGFTIQVRLERELNWPRLLISLVPQS